MEFFVILVNGFEPLTNVTKNLILDAVGSEIRLGNVRTSVKQKFSKIVG